MIVSSKGRYALRVLIDMAEHDGTGSEYVPAKSIAERQEISKKYLEQIMSILSKGGLVDGGHGQKGGYKLTRAPKDYTVGEILRLTEGDLAPVACLSTGAAPCTRSSACRTIAMWSEFNRITNEYFDKITLADLMESK